MKKTKRLHTWREVVGGLCVMWSVCTVCLDKCFFAFTTRYAVITNTEDGAPAR